MSDHGTTDLAVAEIDLRDHLRSNGAAPVTPAAVPWADERRHRQIRLAGVGLLVILNVLDVLTTKAFLDAGLAEGNPVGALLIEQGWMAWTKAALLLALAVRFTTAPPRLGTTAALWCVVGVYLAVVTINTLALRTIGVL